MPKIYTQAFKEDVVKYYERNHTVAETLSEYGISESSLFAWKKQYDQAHQLCIFAPSQRKNLRHSQARLKKTGEMLEVLDRCSCGIYASIDEKMEAIAQLEGQYSVHVLCEVLKLPRGTYYNRKRNQGLMNSYQKSDEALKPLVEKVFHDNMDLLGRKPIKKKLQDMGITVSERRVARLMKELGLRVAQAPYSAEHLKPLKKSFYKNQLMRQFEQTAPNLVWVSDITFVKVGKQYYFVCVVLNLFSRMVLSYGVSDSIDTTLVMKTFDGAYAKRTATSDLMFHSDQGVQYTSYVFREYLRELHIKQSFSAPGNPYDNAVCESFFKTMKKEAIYHHVYETMDELCATLENYINYYNEKRPHRALNMLTPLEKEQEYWMQ